VILKVLTAVEGL